MAGKSNVIQGTISPQFIGPKLLTALHSVSILPVIETAGMLSPLVIKDILKGNGNALKLFLESSIDGVSGVNLCIFSCKNSEVPDKNMEQVIEFLLNRGTKL